MRPESDGGLSQHPVDRLVRDFIQTGRVAIPDEVEEIIGRIATVQFKPAMVTVPMKHRGLSYQGQTLGPRMDALRCHLAQRVVVDAQWAMATTTAEYLADLRRAIRGPATQLAVYTRRGGHIATTLSPTNIVLSPARRGPGSLPELLVIYSADRGIILSGYQIFGLTTAGIPWGARWLK